jgi:hypothetical protein
MNNRGQALNPFSKWFFGLVMLFTVVICYEFFQPLIEVTLPNNLNVASANGYVQEIVGDFSSNWTLGMMALALAFMLYMFLGGLPGQQEETIY